MKIGWFGISISLVGAAIIATIAYSLTSNSPSPIKNETAISQKFVPPKKTKLDTLLDLASKWYLKDEYTRGNFKIKVADMKFTKRMGYGSYGTKADGIYLLLKFRVINQSRETAALDGAAFCILDSAGNVYYRSQNAESNINSNLSGKEFQPNIPAFAHIGFEVPASRNDYSLVLAGDKLLRDTVYLRLPDPSVAQARDTLKKWQEDNSNKDF